MRRNLEARLDAINWELYSGPTGMPWRIRPRTSASLRFGLKNLNEVQLAVSWLERILEPSKSRLVEDSDIGFLHSVAESVVDSLEIAEADEELKLLLGYLKKTIKIVDPEYDVTLDPT